MNKDKQLLDASLKLKVEVIRPTNLSFLINYLTNHQPNLKTILEIGTGCGYSAYQLAKLDQIEKIVSIEKDPQRFMEAKANLNEVNKITLVNADAYTYEPKQKFDIIFIDGPKKQLGQYVDKFLCFLNEHGVMIIDNLYLKDIRKKYEQTKATRLLGLITASDNLQLKLNCLDKKRYNLIVDSSGDGLAIIEVL